MIIYSMVKSSFKCMEYSIEESENNGRKILNIITSDGITRRLILPKKCKIKFSKYSGEPDGKISIYHMIEIPDENYYADIDAD